MLESAYIILQNRRSIPNLAEQWVIDCDTGNDGCRGGNVKKAIEFVSKTTGFYYEGEYPYNEDAAIWGSYCKKRYPTRDLGFPRMNQDKPWIRVNSNP